MTRHPLLLGLLAVAAVGGCARCGGDRNKGAVVPRPVALVNGEPIAAEEVRRELAQVRASGAEAADRLDVLRRTVLDGLLDRALLLQQARSRSIVVGQDQVDRAFLRLRSEYPGTHFDDLLAQERLSQGELKARLAGQLTIERLFQEEVYPGAQVAAGEVDRYYADHPDEFQEPERVHVFQIVVASREEAVQVRDRIRRNPGSFAEIARTTSIAPEGKAGGDLGYIGRGSGYPEVFERCFSLALDTLSEVTPSPYGFHLFKVVDRKPARRRTLDDARADITEKLLRQKRARAQEEYLAVLRKRARVEIDEAALAEVNP
ncbi:MAG TPA: peptidyl-prolyl cis-trans isomerase [Anaeromyxobacteraceae bacterium]|nr:peptidyl-prolyl cis-trans isomerase [Anaeromyxobacteraceae bacterium]